ncbi:class III extradiol dioxygenase subunit B-like domain-containing protein [Nocardiopsis sp. NPDC058631]|uniref:class III extradiol dioxygenase subunit B-like domain-containing protein n=1 Tax=Nocardiopsis sp. NPDC058631 TaxID=3346566 RepID=UPI00365B6435
MIVGTVVCPHPPLLLRELTGGQDVAADLRKACTEALEALAGLAPDAVVVVGGHEVSGGCAGGAVPVREFGGTGERVPRDRALPLSLGVARRLLDTVGYARPVHMVTVAWDASAAEAEALGARIAQRPGRVALLVMGDGSARRGLRAPGHLDERAFGFDEEIRRSLAEGDRDGLLRMDPALAEELLVAGRAAFQAMAGAVGRGGAPVRPEVLYADDPFGVMYFVAVWPCVTG